MTKGERIRQRREEVCVNQTDFVRAAVSTLIDKIEIDDENVYIYWAFE